jgi:hypothetical protein
MRSFILSLFFVGMSLLVRGQEFLSSFHTYWDDSFSEWVVLADDGEITGTLEMKWKLRNDWTQWIVEIGDYSGQVKIKWNNDPGLWEMNVNGNLIEIRTVWPRDYSEWKIKGDGIELRLKSKYRNILEEWTCDHKEYGYMDMFTTREGDVRDWEIEDRLSETVSFEMKLALAFIAIYHATPKL